MKSDFLKTIKLAATVMLVFAIIGAGLLALTKFITKDRIALNYKLNLIKNFNQLVSPESYDNDPATDSILLKSNELFADKKPKANLARKNGNIIAVFLRPYAQDGYNGNIHLLLAVRRDKTLAGVRVLRHRETPGLGDGVDIRKSKWIKIFENKSLSTPLEQKWKVKKDGGDFDQFTGATITPRAIVKAVKNTLLYVDKYYHELFDDS